MTIHEGEGAEMNGKVLQVYDPGMCCSTGVCGPEVDPALVRFAADADWLKRQGVRVERYNLSQEPAAFVGNPAVRRALQERGDACLPLVLWGGEMVASGAYPDRAALTRLVGLSATEAAPVAQADADGAA
jgi:hypothetical protein